MRTSTPGHRQDSRAPIRATHHFGGQAEEVWIVSWTPAGEPIVIFATGRVDAVARERVRVTDERVLASLAPALTTLRAAA